MHVKPAACSPHCFQFGREVNFTEQIQQPSDSVIQDGDVGQPSFSARPGLGLADMGYLRLDAVLKIYPVSRTTWYDGIKQGIYPSPVQLGRRSVGWPIESIRALIANPPKF